MKKTLLSVLLLVLVSVATFAAKVDAYLLYTGFEDGVIPEGWSQEYVSGSNAWVVEKGDEAVYPSGAAEGDYRLLFRNNGTQTERFTTRLITPVVDLQGVTLPVLMFAHAQQQRTGDVDTLRVYYRSTAESRWVLLATYPDGKTNKYTNWTSELIDLPAQSSTYQLAFEATDNFGRGIALDEIIVRPMPTCDVPSNLSAGAVSTTGATLSWLASMDADSIELVVATKELDINDIDASAILLHTFTPDFSYVLTNLERNTTYYWYVNSYCSGEQSGWAGSSFSTRNISSVPYTQQFNLNYAQNTVGHMAYMTQGTSILRSDNGLMEYMPFVNQNTSEGDRGRYSFDSTCVYVFTGARAVTTAIPAGEYVYGATPEMDVDDIRKLSVTFWGGAYSYVDSTYAAGIIVGVMTNPDEYATFVPVDTFYMTLPYEFNRFTADLSKYKGYQVNDTTIEYGKYVAFSSDFKDKKNIFYVDNIVVDYTTTFVPSGISVTNVDYNQFTVNVANLGNTTSWNLFISDKFDYSGKLPSSILYEQKNITGKSLVVKADTLTDKIIYLYAQSVDGAKTSALSLPVCIKMPNLLDSLPFERTWNTTTYNAKYYTTNTIRPFVRATTNRQLPWDLTVSPTDPSNRLPWWYSSAPAMVMTYVGEYIALPAVKDVKDSYVRFSFSPYYYSSESNVNDARLAVGVMTDPFDISTFDSLAVFDGTGVLTPRQKEILFAFDEYKGEGKYIAFKYVLPASGKDGNGVDIYYTNVYSQGECPVPTSLEATPGATELALTWKGSETQKYVAAIYATQTSSTAIGSLLFDTTFVGNSVTIKGLEAHTKYYYNVGTICDADTVWGTSTLFTTDCYDKEPVPYFEDFESYLSSSTTKAKPNCWNISGWSTYSYQEGVNYYPYFGSTTVAGYVHSGKMYMVIGASSASSTNQWLSLPEMDAQVNTLQLSFWLKSPVAGYNDTIFIGLQPKNATDLSNFEQISYIIAPNTSSQYYEYIVRLDGYQGNSEGKCITFLKRSTAQHYWYLEDVKVETLSACAKITDVEIGTIGVAGAEVKWKSPTASEWEVLMSAKALDQAAFDTINSAAIDSTVIMVWEKVTTNPYTIVADKAEVNTTYYVYVRGICDGQYGEWSNGAVFATLCNAQDIDTYTEDFSLAANASCWTMGVRSGTTNAPSFNTNGYLYMFNKTSSDGAYAITPPMGTEDISKYQISFDAHGGTTATYLKEVTVGVITNAADLTTFEPMATLKLNQVSATTATVNYGFNEAYRYTVRFSDYEGDWRGSMGNRVMFLSESGDLENYVYVDNVKFDTISSVLEPLEVWAVEAGNDYAVLTWDTVGTKYEVKVSSKLIDPATETGDKYNAEVEGNGVRVEGLDMLTTYYAYVRTIGADGKTSPWSNMRWFSTQCPASYNLPYKNDFSGKVVRSSAPYDGPECWANYYDGVAIEDYTSGTAFYSRLYATANKAGTVTGDNGLYMGSTFGSATVVPKTSYAVLPKLDADINKAMIEFDWKTTATTVAETSKRRLAIGIAEYAAPYDSLLATVQWLDTLTTGENYGTWIHAMVPLNNYTGNGKYIVLSQFGGNGSTASTAVYIYLDNLQVVEAPSVFAPATIGCGKTFGSTAELTWTQTLGNYSEWQVTAVPAGEEVPENPTILQTFTTTSGTLTGLQGATDYDFYVRAVDNGQVSPWVATPAKGTTLYLVEVKDAFWNFDSQATQEHYNNSTYWKEKGWLQGMIRGTFSNTYVPYLYNNTINSTSKLRTSWYSFSGDTCLRFYSTSTYAGYTVMPQINCNLDSMQLRFKINATYCNENTKAVTTTYAKGTYAHSIKIGYMTDPYDYSTFKEITTYVYPEITTTVTMEDDPTGNRFYQEVTVPLYGVGEGKYIVFSNDFASNQVYIDDVIVEKETGCAIPVQVQMSNIEYNSTTEKYDATFTWGSAKSAWNVKVLNNESSLLEIEKNGVTSLTFLAEGLTAHTSYTFSVQSACDEGETSDWVDVTITTPCVPTKEADASWNLNSDYYQFGTSSTYIIPNCWTSGLASPSTSASNYPYLIANGTTATGYNYARTQENGDYALRFYTTASYYDAYVALPGMNFDLDSMTLHFWGRAAYFFKETHTTATSKGRLYAVNSAYDRRLVIGVMTDVNDFSTFTPLDTIVYDKVWSGTVTTVADRFLADDKTGNGWWQEYAIPLAKYAGKGNIAIVAPKPTAASYFFLDDIEIVKGQFCTAASNVRVADLQSRQVTIAWNLPEDASDSVAVALYLAINGAEPTDSLVAQVDAVLPSHQYTFTNLMPGRDYYYAVKHYCGDEEESPWSNPQKFTCNYEAPRFVEDVEDVRTYPVDWTRGGGTSSTGSTLEDLLTTGTVGSLTETATSNAAWRRTAGTDGMGPGALYSILSSGTGTSVTYSKAWLFSPAIYLVPTEENNMMLSFDMGMWGSKGVGAPATLGEYDYFMVLVSTDGGNTWSEEDSWKWAADGTGDFDYNEVTNERRTWYIDLTAYVGKNIKLAFFANSRTANSTNTENYLYLDNFQLNTFTKREYDAQVCRWNDYEDATFYIDAEDQIAGATTTYSEFIPAQQNGVNDKFTVLNLTVEKDTALVFYATVCEGDSYTENNFAINEAAVSGVYKQKLSGENKCDSIVELYLTVTPKKYVNIEEKICQGSYYEFNGEKYYTNTTLTETFTAADGCDSIVTLYLTVNEVLRGETEEVFLCPGATYNFSEKYPALSEAGLYIDTIQNANGCDSVISVNIISVPNENTLVRAAICAGDRYDEYPFRGLQDAGDWTSQLETVYGCDSVVTLHLLVADANAQIFDTVSVENLPYVLNGETLLPAGSSEGVYTLTANSNCGELTLVLTVGEGQGINNTFVTTLAVTPNPASVGEDVRVLGNYYGATVEVVASTGAVAYKAANLNGNITLPGLPAAGIYLVRLTENGKIYQAKLVVK